MCVCVGGGGGGGIKFQWCKLCPANINSVRELSYMYSVNIHVLVDEDMARITYWSPLYHERECVCGGIQLV